jgi:hypothetical protein
MHISVSAYCHSFAELDVHVIPICSSILKSTCCIAHLPCQRKQQQFVLVTAYHLVVHHTSQLLCVLVCHYTALAVPLLPTVCVLSLLLAASKIVSCMCGGDCHVTIVV